MRNTILFIIVCLFAVSCGKEKFTTVPQIKFKSLTPNRVRSDVNSDNPNLPIITINITDAEGDLGFKDANNVSTIFIKNLLNNRRDSFPLPDIQTVATKNFQGDILINTFDILSPGPRTNRPRVDTLFYEIYVVDFAKNKSNVITTPDPIYYVLP